MSKQIIIEEKEVTYVEIIKIGSGIEHFDDTKRKKALNSSFGRHIKFFNGPPIDADNFSELLQEKLRNLKDLAAIEVSPSLNETEIRLVIEKSMGKQVIQPQFNNSTFIRYISFGLGELIVRPIDMSVIYN